MGRRSWEYAEGVRDLSQLTVRLEQDSPGQALVQTPGEHLPLFQSGLHPTIQDPGLRFAPPWAKASYAFGVCNSDILHRPKGENRTAHGLQP